MTFDGKVISREWRAIKQKRKKGSSIIFGHLICLLADSRFSNFRGTEISFSFIFDKCTHSDDGRIEMEKTMISHYLYINWAKSRRPKIDINAFHTHKRLRECFLSTECYVILSLINDTRLLCFAGLAYTTNNSFTLQIWIVKEKEEKRSIKNVVSGLFYEFYYVDARCNRDDSLWDHFGLSFDYKIDLEAQAVFFYPSNSPFQSRNFLVSQFRGKLFSSVIT
jgi:hypothetical protein